MKVAHVLSISVLLSTTAFSGLSHAATAPAALLASSDLYSGPAAEPVDEDFEDLQNPVGNDPWEKFNRKVFGFNQVIDKYALEPVARGYTAITPKPLQNGVSNFFSNLGELPSIANHLFQLKPHKAVQSTTRFVINSTAGLFGTVDVASRLGIAPQKSDLGQTLGYWGMGAGRYVVLPILGPSSVRDGAGTLVQLDKLNALDLAQTDTQKTWLTVTNTVSTRAEFLPATDLLKRVSLDPYLTTRDAFLASRKSKIEALKDEDSP